MSDQLRVSSFAYRCCQEIITTRPLLRNPDSLLRSTRLFACLTLLLPLLLAVLPMKAIADFKIVVSSTDDQGLPAMDQRMQVIAADPPWELRFKTDNEIDVGALPSDENSLCVEILSIHGPSSSVRGVQIEQKDRYKIGNRRKNDLTKCTNTSNALAFRIVIRSAHNLQNTRLLVDTAGVLAADSRIASIRWRLQRKLNEKWTPIGAFNDPSQPEFTQSSWIEDGSSYALMIVDESDSSNRLAKSEPVPSESVQIGSPPPTRKNRAEKLSAYPAVKQIAYQGPELPTPNELDLPELQLRSDESGRHLYLQIVDGLLEAGAGSVCLRAVYLADAETLQYLVRDDEDELYRTSKQRYSVTENPESMTSCTTDRFLAFPALIDADPSQLKSRIVWTTPDKKNFGLQETEIFLVNLPNTKSRIASLRIDGHDQSTGYWAADKQNGYAAYLWDGQLQQPDRLHVSIVSKHLDNPTLYFGGSPIQGSGKSFYLLEDQAKEFQIGYPAIDIPKVVRLCTDSNCQHELGNWSPESNPFPLSKQRLSEFIGNKQRIFMMLDWGLNVETNKAPIETAKQEAMASASLSQPSSSAIAFKPLVSIGNYARALTTCIGRVVADNDRMASSDSFALKDGLQWVDGQALLETIEPSEIIRTVYDKSRAGGPCPVSGLQSEPQPLSALLKEASNNSVVEQRFEIDSSLFIGYLHLGRKKLNRSRARWNDFLVFFDKVYKSGRVANAWHEGVMFGRDRAADYIKILEPSNNFSSRLAENSALDALAEELAGNGYAPKFFDEFLELLAEQVGPADMKLMYYDGAATDCSEYRPTMDSSGLPLELVVVIAALDNYSPSNYAVVRSVGDDDTISVCAEDSNLVVYAVNGPDVEGNRQWPLVFDIVLNDVAKRL